MLGEASKGTNMKMNADIILRGKHRDTGIQFWSLAQTKYVHIWIILSSSAKFFISYRPLHKKKFMGFPRNDSTIAFKHIYVRIFEKYDHTCAYQFMVCD